MTRETCDIVVFGEGKTADLKIPFPFDAGSAGLRVVPPDTLFKDIGPVEGPLGNVPYRAFCEVTYRITERSQLHIDPLYKKLFFSSAGDKKDHDNSYDQDNRHFTRAEQY